MRSNITSIELGGSTNLAVLAPVKPGFVDGFETITYLDRLHKLLVAVNASRQAQREANLLPPLFPDAIGRFGIIRNFRYAIFPAYPPDPNHPHAVDPEQPHWLTLNITFDGGWEPYMRVIYRDIGTLLDALFSNCSGYPGSRSASYDDYCRWVRENELPSGTFFSDAPLTVADQHYHAEVDRLLRAGKPPATIAAFALPSDKQRAGKALADAKADPPRAVLTALRGVKGFYRLSPFFPRNREREDLILIRFARQVLAEFVPLLPAVEAGQFGEPARELLKSFRDEVDWFKTPDPTPPVPADPHAYDPARLQAGIVNSYPGITHGCLVLMRVEPGRGADAAGFLSTWRVDVEGAGEGDGIRRNVALSHAGLQALGVHPLRIDKLAPEFAQGMEARAGLLGDVHGNHPDVWQRPRRNWTGSDQRADDGGERFDLSMVHVVLTLRLGDAKEHTPRLHARLAREIEAIEAAAGGALKVLGVEPLRSYADPNDSFVREHFGFRDGFSQPKPVPAAVPPKDRQPDEVAAGELVLGYRNDRDDPAGPQADEPLLHDGSFLVLRKLRQHLDALHAVIGEGPAAETTVERMMGRKKDGTPLAPGGTSASNAFDYKDDKEGRHCPFHAHARRANPRDGRKAMPRILRRGMSYGPRADGTAPDRTRDRGVMFMAYCASISEQFEVIQRWISGGNSSGVSSSQSDPLLGVPVPGEARVLRDVDAGNNVRHLELGSKPFVSLQWGMYLFVPSPAALQALPALSRPPAATPKAPPVRPPASLPPDPWRRRLEDGESSKQAWAEVRGQGAEGLSTAYGRLVGSAAGVKAVLADDGRRFSVCGYGARMADSIGLGYLGQDGAEHDALALPVNEKIAAYDVRKVFLEARPCVDDEIEAFVEQAAALKDPAQRVPVDLVSLSEKVLARLCTLWFGLPDDKQVAMIEGGRKPGAGAAPPRCPGHLQTTSRYIFASRPSAAVREEGEGQGGSVLAAVRGIVATPKTLVGLAKDIYAIVDPGTTQSQAQQDLAARTIAGVMLGFPPTVHGNFLRVMQQWQNSRVLWDLQWRLFDARAAQPATSDPELARAHAYTRAEPVLFEAILEAMRENPVPETIWRTDTQSVDGPDPKQPRGDALVVLGLASAVQESPADRMLMFGGAYGEAPHACPGYGMAMGVMMAMASGLLEAGTLRATGSPIALTLIPQAAAAALKETPGRPEFP